MALVVKNLPAKAGDVRHGFYPWVRKIPWRAWQPTPVFLSGESHEWRSLVGYSPFRTKITSLPSCTGSSTAGTRTNIETESLLLSTPHENYLPACVPVQWFFATLWTVAPQAPMSMGFPGKNTAVVPFATPGDLTRPETRLKCPECVALQAYFLLLSHPDNVYTSP